jgi:hypothetical protein
MILKINKYNIGFLRHNSLCRNMYNKKRGQIIPSQENYIPLLSNYVIPSRVAPQQSSCLLHITVGTKIEFIYFLLTLSFQHLVTCLTNSVNQNHGTSTLYLLTIN